MTLFPFIFCNLLGGEHKCNLEIDLLLSCRETKVQYFFFQFEAKRALLWGGWYPGIALSGIVFYFVQSFPPCCSCNSLGGELLCNFEGWWVLFVLGPISCWDDLFCGVALLWCLFAMSPPKKTNASCGSPPIFRERAAHFHGTKAGPHPSHTIWKRVAGGRRDEIDVLVEKWQSSLSNTKIDTFDIFNSLLLYSKLI